MVVFLSLHLFFNKCYEYNNRTLCYVPFWTKINIHKNVKTVIKMKAEKITRYHCLNIIMFLH